MIYNANGRRRRVACPCPKCREQLTEVFMTVSEDGGEVVRQRKCSSCGHKFYTVQQPEYLVRPEQIEWCGKKFRLRQTDPSAGLTA